MSDDSSMPKLEHTKPNSLVCPGLPFRGQTHLSLQEGEAESKAAFCILAVSLIHSLGSGPLLFPKHLLSWTEQESIVFAMIIWALKCN